MQTQKDITTCGVRRTAEAAVAPPAKRQRDLSGNSSAQVFAAAAVQATAQRGSNSEGGHVHVVSLSRGCGEATADSDSDEFDFIECRGIFTVLEKIGEGTFSVVYKARVHMGGSLVALKRLHRTCSPTLALNEIKLLFDHGGEANVIAYLGGKRHRDQITLVLPYFKHDSFRDVLMVMQLEDVRSYMFNLFVALAHIHKHGIMHRDVKPSNFLHNLKERQYRLVDFGLAEIQKPPPPPPAAMPAGGGMARAHASSSPRPLAAPSVAGSGGGGAGGAGGCSGRADTGGRAGSATRRLAPTATCSAAAGKGMAGAGAGGAGAGGGGKRAMGADGPLDTRKDAFWARGGTRGFRAPEVLFRCEYQTVAIDVWSAGAMLLSMVTRRYPFFDPADDLTAICEIVAVVGPEPMIAAATALGKTLQLPSEYDGQPATDWRAMCEVLNKGEPLAVPDVGYDLLARTLDCNPNTRITAAEALRHPWFDGHTHPDVQ